MRSMIAASRTHPSNPSPLGRMWGRLALYLSVYAMTVLLASLLWKRPTTLTMAYALMISVLLWRSHSRSDVAFFSLAALLGPVGEFVAVGFGAWEYSLPLFRIPTWLPLAYGIVGLGLGKVVSLLLQMQLHSASNSREPLHIAPGRPAGRSEQPTRITARNGGTDRQSNCCIDLSALGT